MDRALEQKVMGDGKTATAIIYEFHAGKRLPGKKELHMQKGWRGTSR
ncbi:hypothetical protein AB0D34_35375 [Streptomyces sp. NPDC048420]